MKVRFLVTKRWPHPNGPKRRAGDVVDFPDDKAGKALARQWAKNGIVEVLAQPKRQATPAAEKPTSAKAAKGSKAAQAEDAAGAETSQQGEEQKD